MPPIALNHYGQVCLDASFNCQNLQKEFGKKQGIYLLAKQSSWMNVPMFAWAHFMRLRIVL